VKYFEKPYYVVPRDTIGQEAFAVIRDAMSRQNVAALARVMLSSPLLDAPAERLDAARPSLCPRQTLVWGFCCQAVSERRSFFLAFLIGFFVRPGIPFLRSLIATPNASTFFLADTFSR
jgi:hypothetical protein